MSWFKVDDTAHTHPKLRGAGTAAIGLWTLGGSYAAQYLTDGRVHAPFVKANGTAPQIKKLVAAGLWHPANHACPRCPQPDNGDYQIHDYLIYNPTRVKVMAERERAAEKKRKQRSGTTGTDDSGSIHTGIAGDSSSNRDGFEDESRKKTSGISDIGAGQGDLSPGDSFGTSRAHVNPTRPDPVVPPLEEQPQEPASYASEPVRIGDRPRIPLAAQPLVAALSAAQLVVGWDLESAEWFLIEALVERCGVTALVISARGSWQGATRQPRSARYFFPAWRSLPDSQPAVEPRHDIANLPAAVGGVLPFHANHRPATSDLRAQQAIDAGNRLQALADARQQEQQ